MMFRALLLSILVAAVLLGVNARNQPCNVPKDCVDAGLTCNGGRCVCWTDLGPAAADAWSCDNDMKCIRSFPGHNCRPSKECVTTLGRVGYCGPV